jgi:uncharacterized protein (DUF1786 family)
MSRIPSSVLSLDIGSGTQDLLLWQAGEVIENCVQMVLPSPTTFLAKRVRWATQQRRAVHLSGHLMGGGPVSWAIREHIAAGLAVSAEPEAALTLHDNPKRIRSMGVIIQDSPLNGAVSLHMGDIQRATLEAMLAQFGLDPPEMWCIAVQDHGYQPNGSNRTFRFTHWSSFLNDGGKMTNTIYKTPPAYLTRMKAALSQVPQGMVMDTGMAAIHGAFCDPKVRWHLHRGVLVVNLGNQHTLAALATEDRLWGLFEHHTGALNQQSLRQWIQRFRRMEAIHQDVLDDGGHGCAYHPDGIPDLDFNLVAVTGPRRLMAQGLDWMMAAPFGNMMLSGCYGLLRALHLAAGESWPPGEMANQ